AAAVLTMTLTIGANTAIFSVVNAVLIRALPFGTPEEIAQVAEKNERLNLPTFGASVLNYLSWKELNRSFQDLGAIGGASYALTGRGDPEQFNAATITPSLLPVLGVQPIAGRNFREGEDRPGAAPVAMISEALWRHKFSAQSSAIGSHLMLNGVDYTVVGIAPAGLPFLTNGEIFTPLIIDPAREIRLNHVITVFGRLRRGVTQQQAQADMDSVFTRVAAQYPEIKDWGIRLVTLESTVVPDSLRTTLLMLLGAVGFVLLIACANVANLLLSRAASRQKEIAVRTALGASRWRMLAQLLTESLLLSVAGGAAALLAAWWSVQLMNTALPQRLLPVSSITLDSSVMLFAFGVTLLTGLLFGFAPAWHAAATDLNTVLKQGSRSSIGGQRLIVRNGLVAGELALATVLLVGAGLLMQSLLRLQQVRVGFHPEGVLTFQLAPPASKYPNVPKRWPLFRDVLQSLNTIPGVRNAAMSSGIPMGAGNYTRSPFLSTGASIVPDGTSVPIDWRIVSPGYFKTMGVPLLAGRDFTDQDTLNAPDVAIMSRAAAQKFWGKESPIGKMFHRPTVTTSFTVVGVVDDVRHTSLNQEYPCVYFSSAARLAPVMDIVVRTAGKPESVLSAVRARVHEIDSELPISNVRTMEEWVSNSAAQPRLNAALLAAFAGVALLIAAIGVYGVLAYSVNQRTREIGLRMALGAQQGGVLRWIVTQGMLVAATGIVIGLGGAFALSRLLATLLFGIQPRDPLTFGAVAAVLSVVALAACLVPAIRASRVDPIVALRDE
ncbi:MAG TPA: ABC transporter permease, partial [Candidatus Solibacter sp.]|nr:ABC transporter permease [Candidatus Solibacter sp.]